MATIGQQLKASREAKGISQSEAGSATKILTKVIRAMEANDFSVMPAPTYAKGFIRLYAEYLGLDPEPMVEEYMAEYAPSTRPLIDESSQLEQSSQRSASVSVNLKNLALHFPRFSLSGKAGGFFSRMGLGLKQLLGKGWSALPGSAWKDIRILAGAAAALVVCFILISSISNCTQRKEAEKPAAEKPKAAAARVLLDEPLPDLYLIEPGKIETN